MELSYDWRGYESVFGPHRRAPIGGEPTGPIYAVVDRGIVISAYSDGEDVADWIGTTVAEMTAAIPHREIRAFAREKLDQAIAATLELPHCYQQNDAVRAQAIPEDAVRKKATPVLPGKHFIVEGIESWWAKVLPSAFGVFLRLDGPEGGDEQSFILIIRRGKLESFYEPDLSERGRDPAGVVKYLSEKHSMPVQGIFLSAKEWDEWKQAPHPWRKVAAALRSSRVKMVPFRWSLATLVATRAFLEI